MKDIAIYGAGGLGREVACLIRLINEQEQKWNFIGFFDDGLAKGFENEYGQVLGGMNDLDAWDKHLDLAIAIGAPKTVQLIASKIENPLVEFPNLFAPTTIFLDRSNISFGKGNIVCSRSLFSINVKVGDFNIFNSYNTIGHDVTIGNFNSLMPGARISGSVIIGNRNFFGCDSVVLQTLAIGNDTVIGANSTVIRKTKDDTTYVGNPAVRVKY